MAGTHGHDHGRVWCDDGGQGRVPPCSPHLTRTQALARAGNLNSNPRTRNPVVVLVLLVELLCPVRSSSKGQRNLRFARGAGVGVGKAFRE